MLPDITSLTHAELVELSSLVRAEIEKRKHQELKNLRQEINNLITNSGLSVEEVLGDSFGFQKPKSKSSCYVNPKNHLESWSGRGRKPAWLKNLINEGVDIATLLTP